MREKKVVSLFSLFFQKKNHFYNIILSLFQAQQLTKAVAALLKMNSEEEKLIKETLDRRSSWFGSKKARVKSYNRS